MKSAYVLDVTGWAAVLPGDGADQFGAAEAASCIPAAQRRRLPPFARDVLRCALPLLRGAEGTPIILSSANGDLASTIALLTDVAQGQMLSPSLFGLSVHNASAGALGLCIAQPGDQTAIAGDEGTLNAGLTEAYARLATAEAAEVLLVHGEARLPALYEEFDDAASPVFLAMLLRLVGASADAEIDADADGSAIVAALAAGGRRLRFSLPQAKAA